MNLNKLAVFRPTYLAIVFTTVAFFIWPPLMILPLVLLGLDQVARWHEYETLVKSGSWRPAHFRSSWCSRGVGIAVYGDVGKAYYHSLGYRWWHILPDGGLEVFLKRSFWTSVFVPKVG